MNLEKLFLAEMEHYEQLRRDAARRRLRRGLTSRSRRSVGERARRGLAQVVDFLQSRTAEPGAGGRAACASC